MDFRIQGSSGCASSHQHVAVRHALEPRLVPAVPPQKKLALLDARNLHLQSVSRPFKLNEPSKETDRTINFACRVFVCSQYAENALQPLVAVLCCLRKRRDSINLSCGQKVPEYHRERRETANALVGVCLVVMLCMEPITHLWTFGEDIDLLFTSACGQDDLKFLY